MIVFDLEVDRQTKRITNIGAITNKGRKFNSSFIEDFIPFFKKSRAKFIAGHNIVDFDLVYLEKTNFSKYINYNNAIDTLYFSALLFPEKPYHKLVKDDKLVDTQMNDPVNDSVKAMNLLEDSINAFNKLNNNFKNILYLLLKKQNGFNGFFEYIRFKSTTNNLESLIYEEFNTNICFNNDLNNFVINHPVELAYALSYINSGSVGNSLIPAWVLKKFSKVEEILTTLRSTPCENEKCSYCTEHLSSTAKLKKHFNYESFRKFDGISLQEDAVNSALRNESLIAVFPTGGGKSLTFQLPALISGDAVGGLTVVISPLMSLMKDQVDNLFKKGITKAAYINSLLSPVERRDVFERVRDGSVNILYLSPESLRSASIKKLLLNRQIVRFVIDEAHCFSTWGHDFRPDYLYIGTFIKNLQKTKELEQAIPISCFTATAKHNVISDIVDYFKIKLDLDLNEFKTSKQRTNLIYKIVEVVDEDSRYNVLRNLLETNPVPTIIYVPRISMVKGLHARLSNDGFKVSKFYGKMNSDDKMNEQDSFINNFTDIMIATNAFGMGVDKDDIGVVIHYNISDSLENYMQESGRAGRRQDATAKCFILFNENDLDKHFDMLNRTKLSQKEISQIWSGIKKTTNDSRPFTKTYHELGTIAGWGDDIQDKENRVKTSIQALEDSKFIERGLNSSRIFATSIIVKNAEEAIIKINATKDLTENEKTISIRIIRALISKKHKSRETELAESRIDYLASNLGLDIKDVIHHISILKELNILADDNDLYVKMSEDIKLVSLKNKLSYFRKLFSSLVYKFTEERKEYNYKLLNEEINENNKIANLRTAINELSLTKVISLEKRYKDYVIIKLNKNQKDVIGDLHRKFSLGEFVITYLFNKHNKNKYKKVDYLDFSTRELKKAYIKQTGLIKDETTTKELEEVLLLLHRLKIISVDGGFMVTYSPINITRINLNNYSKYTTKDFEKLKHHYANKYQQIHIVGYFAKLMMKDKDESSEFVNDYFNLEYQVFLDKYFPGIEKKELDLKMSKSRYEKLFSGLSLEQKEVIDDDKNKLIGVLAGPGSGKTTLLVYKLASILYLEEVRHDQLLMLTFSRNAAIVFKEKLKNLIGATANYINIQTFHSFAFDLLGKMGSLDSAQDVIKDAIKLIKDGEADNYKITKTMLVIDEAQDMSEDEYNLINMLINHNEDIRVIAVGDDDQNIYEFRKSNSKYLAEISKNKQYELSINFRSKKMLVDYSNEVIKLNKNRLKTKLIKPSSTLNGNLEVVFYNNPEIIKTAMDYIITKDDSGSTAILTRTNNEAVIVQGILSNLKIKSKLIQDLGDVRLFNIYEIREFYKLLENENMNKIDKEIWDKCLDIYKDKYSSSINFDTYQDIFNKFIELEANPYMSDFKEYLLEINPTNFDEDDKIIVANLHKVKGMEFDNVHIIYENKYDMYDDDIRALYVGLTRARTQLTLHTTIEKLYNFKVVGASYLKSSVVNEKVEVLDQILTLKDVQLYFRKEELIRKLNVLPGDILELRGNQLIFKNKVISRLSNAATQNINKMNSIGYFIANIDVANIVYWREPETLIESFYVLPRIRYKLNN